MIFSSTRVIEQLWQTLCWGQLWASETHNIFNLRNKITEKLVVLLISIFLNICSRPDFHLPTWEKFAPPCFSPDLAQILSSDWLWAPLLNTLESKLENFGGRDDKMF